jgi:hypothetical protein
VDKSKGNDKNRTIQKKKSAAPVDKRSLQWLEGLAVGRVFLACEQISESRN